MNLPSVSIIIPVYNVEPYVEDCILSVMRQTYDGPMECIIVDDCSTDDSMAVVGGVISEYNGPISFKVLHHEHNRGQSVARKHGFDVSNGEWVTFVDSDDLLLENAISKLMELSDGCNIVIGRWQGDEFLINAPCYFNWNNYLYNLYSHVGLSTAPWAKLFRKQLISESTMAFYYDIERAEDFLMNIAIAVNNKLDVKVCKDEIYFYRQRQSSIVHTKLLSCDYCNRLCNIADSIVKEAFSPSMFIIGGIHMRLYYYRTILKEHDYQGYGHHPFAKQIIHLMNKAKMLKLKDRVLLSLTNRRVIKTFLYLVSCYGSLRTKSSK